MTVTIQNVFLFAGINIVSISDVTPIDWGWSKRAKKRRRVN
jgi:ribosomal protein S11